MLPYDRQTRKTSVAIWRSLDVAEMEGVCGWETGGDGRWKMV